MTYLNAEELREVSRHINKMEKRGIIKKSYAKDMDDAEIQIIVEEEK